LLLQLKQEKARHHQAHQTLTDELRRDQLGGAGEEALGEVLGERGGYWIGFGDG